MKDDKIRYFMGKLKVIRLTNQSVTKTAIYKVLEERELKVSISDKKNNPTRILRKFTIGEIMNIPCRRCFINRKDNEDFVNIEIRELI